MNIYDIARMAGVSIATVSRVVNGSDKVSEKTKQRVLSVIEEAGYTPNVFAQGLGLNTMHTVGIMVPRIDDMYMAAAVSYLEQNLQLPADRLHPRGGKGGPGLCHQRPGGGRERLCQHFGRQEGDLCGDKEPHRAGQEAHPVSHRLPVLLRPAEDAGI